MVRSARGVEVFPRVLLAWTLGLQYVVGAGVATLWLQLPRATGAGAGAIALLAALALLLGTGLCLAAWRRCTPPWLAHAAIAVSQVVIGLAVSATGDPDSPLLFLWMWTIPYVGIFRAGVAVLHVTWTGLTLAVTLATMPEPVLRFAPGSFLLTVTSGLVVALLVHRMTTWLHERANKDALTGLANRALFLKATGAALARSRGTQDSVAVFLVDLDRFKVVNDTHGHHTGDELLRVVARRLREHVRSTDLVARLGGDEFAVLAVEPQGGLDAVRLGQRLAGVWDDPVPLGHGSLHTSGSIGVTVGPRDGETAESMLRDADAAMYQAKAAGAGQVAAYDARMRVGSERRLRLEQALRRALADGELHLAYQPVVRLRGQRVIGAEALLRWTSAEFGAVSPAEFIPIAEETGLVVPIGAWVLERAAADLASWSRQGAVDPSFTVAVNVSARQLTPELPQQVGDVLARHGLPASRLGLEITESALLTPGSAAPVLGALKELGVTLLLDDFGTGFSSLSHLQQFPFDVLKIDRSFVADLCEVPRQRSIVTAILSMAEALDLDVIAEGIETAEQSADLERAGCDAGQGYHFSRPVPAADLPAAAGRPGPWPKPLRPLAEPAGALTTVGAGRDDRVI